MCVYVGVINIQSPFVDTDMIALSCPRPEDNGAEIENKNQNQNQFVLSFHSFKKIGQDFFYGVKTRRDKSLYSSYDIINFMTF